MQSKLLAGIKNRIVPAAALYAAAAAATTAAEIEKFAVQSLCLCLLALTRAQVGALIHTVQ